MTAIKPSDQQYRILRVLWSKGEASAREVLEALPDDLAHTTVGTVLARLEKKGLLESETKGRERFYRPLVSEGEVKRSMVSSLVSTLFKGDSAALVAHLVQESEIGEDDLETVQKLLEDEA